MKLLRRIVIALLVLLVVGYAGAAGYMYTFQRSFQYAPEGKFMALGETLLTTAEQVEIPTSNNERIRGWYAPPTGAGKPVIVYYKGNADSFSEEHVRFEAFVEDGYGFLAFDYRGFPASPGVLNQENVLKDAIAAFAFAENKGFLVVIWGRSLGSGPATYVASERNAEALLLETPFDSAVAVAKDRYWFLPVDLIMQDTYRLPHRRPRPHRRCQSDGRHHHPLDRNRRRPPLPRARGRRLANLRRKTHAFRPIFSEFRPLFGGYA